LGDDLLPLGFSEHWLVNIHKEGCVPVVTGTAASAAAIRFSVGAGLNGFSAVAGTTFKASAAEAIV
jgi:hypothetical protein